jgi:hypothetical protein
MSPGSILAAFLLTAIAQTGQIDFKLQNDTPFGFDRAWIARHGTGAWGHDLLDGHPLRSGWAKEVVLKNDSNWRLWDLKIEYRQPLNAVTANQFAGQALKPKTRRRLEIFMTDGFELPVIKVITVTVISGEKWDAHYE